MVDLTNCLLWVAGLCIVNIGFVATSNNGDSSDTTETYNETWKLAFACDNGTQGISLKQCSGGQCLLEHWPCSKCGPGVIECDDNTCITAGEVCESCMLGERMCGNGNCTKNSEKCMAPCGKYEIECHDHTCEQLVHYCKCSNFHTICDDGKCVWNPLDCPEFHFNSYSNNYQELFDPEWESNRWFYMLLLAAFGLLACMCACGCRRRKQAAQ